MIKQSNINRVGVCESPSPCMDAEEQEELEEGVGGGGWRRPSQTSLIHRLLLRVLFVYLLIELNHVLVSGVRLF